MLKKEGKLMNGLLYKEFRQNRFTLLICAGLALVFLVLPIQALFEELGDVESLDTYMMVMKRGFSIIVFFVGSTAQSMFFKSDEVKKYAYFSASTPEGVEGTLWRKYTAVFMLTGICFIYCYIVDAVFCIFAENSSVISLVILIIYAQIFLRAIEIPFWVRFGANRGSMVKAAFVLVIWFAVILYALFGDLSILNENLEDEIMEALLKFMEGDVPDWVFLVQGIFPFAAAALYYLSYKISCKLYLKGVEEFDK